MVTSAADFEKVYNGYYTEIRRFIFTIARRDPDITDEISQNVWQNAFRYMDSLRNADSMRSWLYAIARNESKRYFANRHTAFFADTLTLDTEEAESAVDERDSVFPETLADSDLVAKLLGSLSENEQRIIILYYAYGVELREIAALSGTNYNTLKSNYRRAMEKLRKSAKEQGTEAL